MKRENIEKWSLGYQLLRYYIKFGVRRYYKQFIMEGKENIPDNEPVVIAPVHQNALMDPLVILLFIKRQPVCMARADIFKSPLLIQILTFFKILPIYRLRDGFSNLQNNDEIFDKAVDILSNKKMLIILPEGGHAGYRYLRPLKKGIGRIVFKAEELSDYKLGVKIIPAGIEYGNYVKFYQNIYIKFGKPIEVKDYIEKYKENPNKTIANLTTDMADRIKANMINIENKTYYKLYNNLREIYKYRLKDKLKNKSVKFPDKFNADRKLIEYLDIEFEKNPDAIDGLSTKVIKYSRGLKKLNLRNWLFNRKKYSFIVMFIQSIIQLASLPIFIYGYLNNYFPYKIPVLLGNKIKDAQFRSSIKNVSSLVLFPVFYIIQFLIVKAIFDYTIALLYLASLPITAYFALYYYFALKKLRGRFIYTSKVRRKDASILQLINLRKEIFEETDRIVDLYKE